MTALIEDRKQRGILVVDDELGPRVSLKMLMKCGEYSNVHFARNGAHALSKLAELGSAIYLVLVDIRMPHTDGLTFFRQLKTEPHDPIGVVVVTGYASSEVREQFMGQGTADVLALDLVGKPYDARQLLDCVAEWLDIVHARRQVKSALPC